MKDKLNVVHWNITKIDQKKIRGIKRYEDELYNNLINNDRINLKRIMRTTNTLLAYLKDYKFRDEDIIHGTCQEIANVVLIKNIPNFVLTIHDIGILDTNQLFPGYNISHKLQYLFIRNAIKRIENIIAISEFTKNEIIRLVGIEEEKIHVVYQGIDHDFFKVNNHRKYEDLDPVHDKYLILAMGTICDELIEIIYKIKQKGFKCEFILAGDEWGEQFIEKINKLGLDNVKFIGYVEEKDLPKLYNDVDLFIYPSKYEGFGLNILEAISCGCPVLTTNSSSLPEIIGDISPMVEMEDIEEWVKNIIHILTNEDLRKDIIKKGIDRSAKFSWKKTAEETLKIYENIYANKR